jgi:hypothetical protein
MYIYIYIIYPQAYLAVYRLLALQASLQVFMWILIQCAHACGFASEVHTRCAFVDAK